MTNIEKFVALWQAMDQQDRLKVLKFLTKAYGENFVHTCNKLWKELEEKRNLKGL